MSDAEFLAALPGLAFAAALVLARVGAAMMLLPGLGEAEPPAMLRAGMALAFTLLLLPGTAPLVTAPQTGWGAAGMVTAELLTGGALGWLARLPVLALGMAGGLISLQTGLSSVVQPDPALGGASSAPARLMGLVAPVVILSGGLYALPLGALARSYAVVPPGGLLDAGQLAQAAQQIVSAGFDLALRLSAPFILAGLLLNAGLGLLARLAPQLQIYSIAAPGQIVGGLLLLALLAAPLLGAWIETVRTLWAGLPGS